MVSEGEREVSRVEKVADGDCLLRIFERSLRRMRCGIMTGKDGSHERGMYVLWWSVREAKDFFMASGGLAGQARMCEGDVFGVPNQQRSVQFTTVTGSAIWRNRIDGVEEASRQ